MQSASIARRYRPRRLQDLIGQEVLQKTLIHAFESNNVGQAYVFIGIRGVGKTTTMRILARCFNCEKGPTATPCLECAQCLAIDGDNHPDLVEIDAATHSSVEDIRNQTASVAYRPLLGRTKLLAIDEAHSLSDKAWEALLKTVEEPPPHQVFVFATTEARKIPATLLSRCQVFALRRIDPITICEHLETVCKKENISAEQAALAHIGRAADGSMRDAMTLLEQAINYGAGKITVQGTARMLGVPGRGTAAMCLLHALNKDAKKSANLYRQLLEEGGTPEGIIGDLLDSAHLMAIQLIDPTQMTRYGVGPEEGQIYQSAANHGTNTIQMAYTELSKLSTEIPKSLNPNNAIEMTLFRIAWR